MSERVEVPQPQIDVETAIRAYNEYLEDHPYSTIFVPLANLHRMQGRFDEAIRVCQEGLRIFPRYFTARTALALACCGSGDYAGARTELERVVSSVPENVLARRVLSEIHRREGDVEKALAQWEAIAALFPDHAGTAERVRRLREELAAGAQLTAHLDATEEVEVTVATQVAPAGIEPPSEADPGVDNEVASAAAVEDEEGEAPPAELEEPGAAVGLEDAGPRAEAPAGEAQEPSAEVAAAFVLEPPPPEGELPPVVEPPPVEEGPVEDPRQEALEFDEQMAGPEDVPTQTLAELYEARGDVEQAIQTYQALLGADLSRDDLRQKLEVLARERDRASEGAVAEGPPEPEGAQRIGFKYRPFFLQERGLEEEALAVGDSLAQDTYEKERADRERREATLKVVAELEQWMRRLRGHEE